MDQITIAVIVRPRGLRGEVVADLLTDFPERFDNLKRVFAAASDGVGKELEIEEFWFQKGRVVLKFRGVESIEEAEKLRGLEVRIPESEAVELEDDQYFDWQLQECAVQMPDGEPLGRVREILRAGGSEILVVVDEKNPLKDFMIPFVVSICVEVDIEKRLITVDPPEGLLGF